MLKATSIDLTGASMKAAFFMQHGSPEVLQYGDVPDPVAGPGELLVDVHAASVNAATPMRRDTRRGLDPQAQPK